MLNEPGGVLWRRAAGARFHRRDKGGCGSGSSSLASASNAPRGDLPSWSSAVLGGSVRCGGWLDDSLSATTGGGCSAVAGRLISDMTCRSGWLSDRQAPAWQMALTFGVASVVTHAKNLSS